MPKRKIGVPARKSGISECKLGEHTFEVDAWYQPKGGSSDRQHHRQFFGLQANALKGIHGEQPSYRVWYRTHKGKLVATDAAKWLAWMGDKIDG